MIENSKGHLMKTCIRLAFLSTMLLVVPAQGSQDLPAECPVRCETPNGDKLPPVIGGVCLSHYVSQWQMVNDVLILQPDKNARLTAGQAIGLFLSTNTITVAAGALAGILTYRFAPVSDDNQRKGLTGLAGALAAGLTGFFGGRGIYRALRKKALENAQRAQMDLIVTWWHDVHAYFPEEVHKIFEELVALKAHKANEYGVSRDKAYKCIIEMLRAHYAKRKEQVYYFPWVKDGITRKGQKNIYLGSKLGVRLGSDGLYIVEVPHVKPEDQVIDYPETV